MPSGLFGIPTELSMIIGERTVLIQVFQLLRLAICWLTTFLRFIFAWTV